MNEQKLDLKEGSINFWIPENTFDFDDDQSHILINYGSSEGSIFIVKDADNKFKFFHVILGKGRTDVAVDTKGLSRQEKHMVTVTWSVHSKEINIYIDGNKKHQKTTIIY